MAKYNAIDAYVDIIEQFNITGITQDKRWVWLLIVIECSAAVALTASLLQPIWFPILLIIPIAVLMLYFSAIAVNLMQKRHHIKCGCAGAASQQTISAIHLWRLAVLLFLLALSALPSATSTLDGVTSLLVFSSSLLLILFYLTSDMLIENHSKLATLRN